MYHSFRMHVDSGFVFGPIIVNTGLSISCIPWRNRSQSWPRQPEYGLLFLSRPQWADHRYHPGYCVFIWIWCLAKNIVAKQSLDAFGLESSNFLLACAWKKEDTGTHRTSIFTSLSSWEVKEIKKLHFTSLIINSSMVTLRNLHRACRTWLTYWRRSWLARKLSPIQSQPNKCSHFENYVSWETTITSSSRSLSERCGPLSVV